MDANLHNSNFLHNDSFGHHCNLTLLSDIVVYMLSGLSMLGALVNFFSALICLQIIVMKYEHRSYGHIYKFLFIKSLDDFILFSSQAFSFTFYCAECINNHSRAHVVWSIYFEHYIESIFEFCSAYMQVLVTLDCLLTIKNICPFSKSKWYPCILIGVFHLYAAIFYLFWVFSFKMVEENGTYDIDYEPFYHTAVDKGLRILSAIQKNLVPFLIMLCLIPCMLKLLNDIYKIKVFVINGSSKSTTINKKIKKKFILLILLVGILDIIGRMPEIIFYVIDSRNGFWVCFNEVSKFFYAFSCLGDTFLYYFFNQKFKNTVKQNVKKIYLLKSLFSIQQNKATISRRVVLDQSSQNF